MNSKDQTMNPMLSIQKSVVLLTLSLLGLPFLAGCGAQGGWQMPPPVVGTAVAEMRDWTVEYGTTGTLEANNKVDLNAEIAGTVTDIYVREGDVVKRGQVLMRLRADKQMAQLQQSAAGVSASVGTLEQHRADIRQAQARLESATVRKNLAQSELQRFEKLFSDQFVSQLELDQRRTNYETAASTYQESLEALAASKARYNQAESSLAQAESGYRYSMAAAGETVIRAPFSGVVGQKYVDIGDYVAPAAEKLITVVDPSSFKIEFSVPERYLDRLQLKQEVKVTFEALGHQTFTGRVNFIAPVVEPETRTVLVKAVLPASPALRHGMFGKVALALGTVADAVVIPEQAIVPQGEKTFVYVVRREVYHAKEVAGEEEDKKAAKAPEKKAEPTDVAHLQEVVVANRKAGAVQISSGLRAGDLVITDGLQKVTDNQQVVLKGKQPANGMKGP